MAFHLGTFAIFAKEQLGRIFLGHETEFILSLDNKTFLPLGQSSSDLSKSEMSALLDFIASWAAQNGVELHQK